MTLKKKSLENTVEKGQNAGNQHFNLFPQCFLLYQNKKFPFKQYLICHLQMVSIWSRLEFGFGKELTVCNIISVTAGSTFIMASVDFLLQVL